MSDAVARLNVALEGRYEIERDLGEGGMAIVYLAKDLKHNRPVALKVLKPELAAVVGAERFLAEIETTANLQHPHILPLFDSGEADSFLFYVMPYIEGETLRERIDRDKQLPVDEALGIATAVANALQVAHEAGIVHRDIKPGNILMSRGEPLVADFGIALAVSAGGGGRLTETGLSLGTPFYMSPEQATGDQHVGPPSDTYALASVLYEMLTGDPPYVGSTAQAVLGKIIQGAPVSASEIRKSVPANVDAAIRKALEKLPADRFTGAQDFARALADPGFRHGEAAVTGVARGGGPWNRLTIGFAATTAILGLAFVWASTRPEDPQPVLRSGMIVPDQLPLVSLFGPNLAVSPDGTAVAFASESEGVPELGLLERDQLEPRPLDGTEGAWQPTFSPDGSRVGFITQDRQFKVVSLSGAPPLTVVDSGLVRGGASWGRDGFIYFAAGTSTASEESGLGRVPENGGPIEAVTLLDTARAERSHSDPVVLPGGRGVLFTIMREQLYNSETMEIAVGDLETGEHKVLLQGLVARWSPTGHILVVRDDGAVLAAPFNPETLELQGTVVPLLDGVALEYLGGTGQYPSSVEFVISETGTLVYAAGSEDGRGGRWGPVWVTRDGAVQEIDPDMRRGDFAFPALSPEGDRLAVTLTEAGETHVWVKQLDRGPMSKLTFQGSRNFRPAWTADGRTIGFVSNQGDNNDLFARRADGSAQAELVLDSEQSLTQPTYSSDGEWMVYRGGNDIFARRVGVEEEPIQLTESDFNERHPALSPDGRFLAYTSNESGRPEVYVRPFPNVGEERWMVSTGGGHSPRWARSGQELFYAGLDQQMMTVPLLEGTTFTYEQPRALFPTAEFREVPAPFYDVSPDGDRFVMMQGATDSGLIIVVDNFFEEIRRRVAN